LSDLIKHMITGDLLLREQAATAPDGRRLAVVAGLLAIPRIIPIDFEVIYPVVGDYGLMLRLLADTKRKPPIDTRLHSIDGLLRQKIWRT
jgi:hypothetical protein